ncbi:MAG: site-specific DNA-methyltransferase [Planctomycetota bacterium]
MKVELRKIEDIKPYPGNPRVHDSAVDAIADSIREYGWNQCIVVDTHGVVICGHGRLLAAQKLGLTEVPVHIAENLTEAQVKSYRIRDNQCSSLSSWNYDALRIEIDGLQSLEYDIGHLGFGPTELEAIMGPGVHGNPGLTDPDDVPEPPQEPITRPGDIWALGNHKIYCGDSADPGSFDRLLAGEMAEMMWTDPPYNVAYVGKTKDALQIQNDAMAPEAFGTFIGSIFQNSCAHISPGGAAYICHADTERVAFTSKFVEAGFHLSGVLIWRKNTIVMGHSDYQWQHEPLLYGWREGAPHRFHGDRTQSTVLDVNKPSRSAEHPTMKPVELIMRGIVNSSLAGQIVLDPCGGSGSTLIACEKTGRQARLIEVDPRYCDVICKRFELFSGQKAQRVECVSA